MFANLFAARGIEKPKRYGLSIGKFGPNLIELVLNCLNGYINLTLRNTG